MERSRPLNSHSAELDCRRRSISHIDHARSAGKRRLWSPPLDVRRNRSLMRSCQQRTGKQINGTQRCRQGRDGGGAEGHPRRPAVAGVNISLPGRCRLGTCSSPQEDKRPHPFLKPWFELLLQLTPSKCSLNRAGMGRNEHWKKHLWGELKRSNR